MPQNTPQENFRLSEIRQQNEQAWVDRQQADLYRTGGDFVRADRLNSASVAGSAAALTLQPALQNGDTNNIIDPKRPGTYLMEKVNGVWTATQSVSSVQTDKAAINGMLNSPGYAAWLMGQHMDAAFPETQKFTIFYNPTEGFAADAWESLRDKLGVTTDIAKQFSGVLQQVQASGRQVDWVAHSQGGIIFTEAVRVSGTDLSNNSVVFHAGGNNEVVTNTIMHDAGVQVMGYRNNPLDPVPNIAGFNTLNPVKWLGSVLSLPAVIWGGTDNSPHTLPYVAAPSK